MTQQLKKIPHFKSEDAERNFWAKHSIMEFARIEDFVPVSFPNLKPTTRPISVRVPEFLLAQIKERANELNIPYQSLMKQYLAEGVAKGNN